MTKPKNIYEINSHPRYKKYGGDSTRTYTSTSGTGTLGFQEVEVGEMSMDYITRPEFEQHEKYMEKRFDNVDDKIDNVKEVLSGEIQKAVLILEKNINEKKVTTGRFWLGITIPSVISIISIIVSIVLALYN